MKLSKGFLVLALVIGLVMMVGQAKAATSAIENVPGGAGVIYFQASPGGLMTVFNIQNVVANLEPSLRFPVGLTSAAILVHAAVYDSESRHLADFNIPLSPRDNWGAVIVGDGTNITIIPLDVQGHFPPGIPSISRLLPGSGPDNLQYGYITFAITACDDPIFGGNNNGDPRDDPNFSGTEIVLPNMILVRYALLYPNSLVAMNAPMLQDFFNDNQLREADPADPDFVNTWPAVNVGIRGDWNCDNDVVPPPGQVYNGTDDANGINIDPWELYASEHLAFRPAGGIIMDDTDPVPDAQGDVAYPVFGSANGVYWARFHVDPDAALSSTLVTVYPASTSNTYCNRTRAMSILCYDDEEWSISTGITPPEVALSPFGTATPLPGNSNITIASLAGCARIETGLPMFGFTLIDYGGTVTAYPLVKNRQNIVTININAGDAGAGRSDVRVIGW